jgi:long-chain acyl-CoA synthetase
MLKKPNYVGTINHLIAESAKTHSALPALTAKIGKEWRSLTYSEVEGRMRRFSLGLRALGIEKADRVAVLSENRPEWAVADLAILAMGAVTVPVYPNLPTGQVAHILADSGARAIVASDAKQLEKATASVEKAPGLTIFIVMDGAGQDNVLSFDAVLKMGEETEATITPAFEELRDSVKPDDLATIVYTSGTTGDPKGAMLTHGNLYAATQFALYAFPFDIEHEVFLSFLPLCHVFERVTYYLALGMGVNTYYAESIFKVRENMVEVRPSVMQSVPRLFEAIYEAAMAGIAKEPVPRQRIARWAIAAGTAYARRTNVGKLVSPLLALQRAVADKLVLSKLREKLGGRWHFFVSGGAALPAHTAEFFQGIGIPVAEGYGLTETTAATCVNPLGRARIGTVGKILGNAKIKVAPDGELLVSGLTIMKGYWNHSEATAQAIDSDGWFHTGDIGEIDRDGYVRITDRKKDIIVLANGKKVAPQPIEAELRAADLVSEIVLIGDQSGTVSALVVPDFDKLAKWAKAKGLTFNGQAELVASAEARKAVKQQIDELSRNLADFEKIRRIALLDHALSIDAGELTPTLKVRRKVVHERYGHLLD